MADEEVAVVAAQEAQFGLGFHALGGELHPQPVAHGDDAAHDGGAARVAVDVADEAAADLEPVQRILGQRRETQPAHAEVLHRQGGAQCAQPAQGVVDAVRVQRQRALGQLEFERTAAQLVLVQALADHVQAVGAREQDAVDEDRQAQVVQAALAPVQQLVHRRVDHPQPELAGQAGAFDAAEEPVRPQQAMVRRIPAQQRAEADQAAILGRDLRLEVQAHLVVAERLDEAAGERALRGGLGPAPRVQADVVVSAALDLQQRTFGPGEQGGGIGPVFGEHRDPDRHRDRQGIGRDRQRRLERVAEAVGQRLAVGLALAVGDAGDELVARQPPQ